MEEELLSIKNNAVSLILDAPDLETLEDIKLQFLGKSGKLTLAIKEIAKIPEERRPAIGVLANEVKSTVEDAIENQEANLKSQTSRKFKGRI